MLRKLPLGPQFFFSVANCIYRRNKTNKVIECFYGLSRVLVEYTVQLAVCLFRINWDNMDNRVPVLGKLVRNIYIYEPNYKTRDFSLYNWHFI